MLVCDGGIFHQNGGGDGSMVVVMLPWWLSLFQAGISVSTTMVVVVVGVITCCYPCQHGDSSDNACLIIIKMELIKLIDVVGVMFMIAVIVDMVWVARWLL